jgi:hypothetical protein
MIELGIPATVVRQWAESDNAAQYLILSMSNEVASQLAELMPVAVRRCYIADNVLLIRSSDLARSGGTVAQWQLHVLEAVMPPPGSVMSGDFGEILSFTMLAAHFTDGQAIGPKKWRLKEDPARPAPHTDIVQFVLPQWPTASASDELLCAEVKTKATASNGYHPIQDALRGCQRDRTSRLARTLVWLRQCELRSPLGSVTLDQLDRFINAVDFPAARKSFRAVVVICSTLWEAEKLRMPLELAADCELLIIVVPSLHSVYTKVFAAARASVLSNGEAP